MKYCIHNRIMGLVGLIIMVQIAIWGNTMNNSNGTAIVCACILLSKWLGEYQGRHANNEEDDK